MFNNLLYFPGIKAFSYNTTKTIIFIVRHFGWTDMATENNDSGIRAQPSEFLYADKAAGLFCQADSTSRLLQVQNAISACGKIKP